MVDTQVRDDDALIEALIAALADGAAHTFDALFDGVVDLLPADTDEAEATLEDVLDGHGRFLSPDDERWIDLHALLEGRCFTHRLTGPEVAGDVVVLRPDIDAVTMPFTSPIPFAGGRDGEIVFPEDFPNAPAVLLDVLQGGGLRGPDGWLGDAGEGSVVGIWFTDGALDCRPAEPDATLTVPVAAALSDTFNDLVDRDDDPVDLIELMLTWMLSDADALRAPLEPLRVLLEAAGLESRGDFVGRAGTDWMTPQEHMRLQERALHTEAFGFDDCCHDALDVVYGVFHGITRDVGPRETAVALSHGSVAEAFTMSMIMRAGHHLDEMGRQVVGFVDELVVHARGAEAAGALYVQSAAFDWLGEVTEAEDAARAVLRLEPGHRAAAEALAGYLEVRGEAARAIEHLRRAGVRDDDRQMLRLAEAAAHAAPRVARNDPCPCGSGKKFKACCIDAPSLPRELQVRWLYGKAMEFVAQPARSAGPVHLAAHALAVEGSDESPSVRAGADVRFAELSLFDEGLLERFLDEREALLPAAEVAIAEEWVARPLGLFEVTELGAHGGATLRRADGARVTVDTTGTEGVAAGDVIVGRLLPVGDDLWLGGPVISVPPALVSSARAVAGDDGADACAWAEWIGYSQSPEAREGLPPARTGGHGHHH